MLSAAREGDSAVLRVGDTGIGIPPEMLSRIFDMFTQVDNSLGKSQGGLGIGLTLVKRLVEMHGGTVEAHSEGQGKGSEFVRLPLLTNDVDSPPERRGGDSAPRLAKLRILVVDDNTDSAESLTMLLSLQGHDVRTANDGPEALDATADFRPDVVLLDIGLPGMNGYEVAQRIRKDLSVDKVRLVAVTGWGQEEDRRRSKEAGFDHHLVKPAASEALQKILSSVHPKR